MLAAPVGYSMLPYIHIIMNNYAYLASVHEIRLSWNLWCIEFPLLRWTRQCHSELWQCNRRANMWTRRPSRVRSITIHSVLSLTLLPFFLKKSLATETEYVRTRLAEYANDLISLGIDGFRLDAAECTCSSVFGHHSSIAVPIDPRGDLSKLLN